MSQTLQQHGRGITSGFSRVTHRQAAACGELVSESEAPEDQEGLTRTEQVGIGLGLLVLLIGGAIAVGGE